MSALAILLSSDGTHIQSFSTTEDGNGTVGGSIGEHGSGGSATEDIIGGSVVEDGNGTVGGRVFERGSDGAWKEHC